MRLDRGQTRTFGSEGFKVYFVRPREIPCLVKVFSINVGPYRRFNGHGPLAVSPALVLKLPQGMGCFLNMGEPEGRWPPGPHLGPAIYRLQRELLQRARGWPARDGYEQAKLDMAVKLPLFPAAKHKMRPDTADGKRCQCADGDGEDPNLLGVILEVCRHPPPQEPAGGCHRGAVVWREVPGQPSATTGSRSA